MRLLALPSIVIVLSLTSAPNAERQAARACGSAPARSASAFAVVERRAPADTLATVTICLMSDTAMLHIAGYHGELTLSRNSRVVHVDRPSGGTRIENTTVPGRVSFAGVLSSGINSGPVLALTVARLSAGDDARLRLTMLDVTDVGGRDVAAQVRVDSMPRPTRQP